MHVSRQEGVPNAYVLLPQGKSCDPKNYLPGTYTTAAAAEKAATMESIKNVFKAIGTGIGGVAALVAGVLNLPVTLTAGTGLGALAGAINGVIKHQKGDVDIKTQSQWLKDEALQGAKFGAIGFFLLAEMAFKEAHALATTPKPEVKHTRDGGQTYTGL